MYGTQINCALRANSTTRGTFKGCFAIDKIPFEQRRPLSFVINSDKAGDPGEHWMCVYIDGQQTVFFDSLGLPPNMYSKQLHEYLTKMSGRQGFWENSIQLQSDYSNLCGQYCIHALQTLSITHNPMHVIRPFTLNREKNDMWIAKRFRSVVKKYKHCNLGDVDVQLSKPPMLFI